MQYWIRAYNNKMYRVADFIRDHGFIEWGTRQHFHVGDIIFLYATAPLSRLQFAMEVTAVGLSWKETTDDSSYFLSQEHYDDWLSSREKTKYARYELIKELHSPLLTYHNLMEHGLGGAPRSPRRLWPEVVDYIMAHLE